MYVSKRFFKFKHCESRENRYLHFSIIFCPSVTFKRDEAIETCPRVVVIETSDLCCYRRYNQKKNNNHQTNKMYFLRLVSDFPSLGYSFYLEYNVYGMSYDRTQWVFLPLNSNSASTTTTALLSHLRIIMQKPPKWTAEYWLKN